MAFSVESRLPLLDHRVAELAGRIGFEPKTTPGRTKAVLRSAARSVVPDRILDRKDKRGFPTPVEAWLTDPDLDLFGKFVLSGNPFAERYFDLARVRRMLRQQVRPGSGWSETLWRVLALSVWGQVFAVE